MVTQELISYIEKARSSGQSDAQIKSSLLNVGWSEADIEQAISGGVSSGPVYPQPRSSSKFFPITISLVVLLLVVAGASAYFYPSFNPFKKQIAPVEESKKQALETTLPPLVKSVEPIPQESQLDICKKEKLSKFDELKAQSKNFKFPFEPIYIYGAVNYPIKTDFSKLNIIYGIFDISNLHSDGSFCLISNKKQEGGGLVSVVLESGVPVLETVIVSPYEGREIIINTNTTATTLVYVSPGVASTNTRDAKITLDYINSLKETSDLSMILNEKLSKQNVFLYDIVGNITNNISDVLKALIQKVKNCGGLIESCTK